MGENLGHIRLRHAVLLGAGQVIGKRAVDDAFPDERAHGDDAAQLERQLVLAAPYLAEEDVVVQMRELGRELAECIVSCGLLDCHF